MRKDYWPLAVVGALVALSCLLGLVLAFTHETPEVEDASGGDIAREVAMLHAQAQSGALRLEPPKRVAGLLMDAHFPPKKPAPDLDNAAVLKGAALSDFGRAKLAVAHYTTRQGAFTLVTIPAEIKHALPPDAAKGVLSGGEIWSATRDEVPLVFWKGDHWVFALATTMAAGDRQQLVERVRRAQGAQ